jgi:hypothetical protein
MEALRHYVYYFPKVGKKNICGMTVAVPTSQADKAL